MRSDSKRQDRSGSRGRQGQQVSLGNLLVPRQLRKNSLSGQKAAQPTTLEDDIDPMPGIDPTTHERVDLPSGQQEQKQAKMMVPQKLIKMVSHQQKRPAPVESKSPIGYSTPGHAIKTTTKTVISSMSSMISTKNHHQQAPVKLQRLDVEKLRKTFYDCTAEFASEIDQYFKSYNRFIKESKNKIDVQVKATKREKQLHAQFLNREEIKFWKEFPRSLKFYHYNLHKIKQAVEPMLLQSSGAKKMTSAQAPNTLEVRDIDLLILTALDFQPFASWKFCELFNLEQCHLLTDEAWRNASISNSHTDNNQMDGKDSFADQSASFSGLTNPANISTFDNLTQSLKMFDSDDAQNWRILGLTSMLLVADTIALILEQPNKIQREADKKNKVTPLPPLELSSEVALKLIEFCKRFASFKLPQDQTEIELEELSIIDILFDKVQFTWANKIYKNMSTMSQSHFDACLKFLQRALQNDHRQVTDEAKEVFIQEIYFARYLAITPENVNMADKVLGLLEKFIQMLSSEHCSDDFKLGLLATLKYLVENLCFYQSEVCGRQHILPLNSCSFEPNAMQIQAASVARIYTLAENLAAKQNYKEHAILLMATILKISHEDFVEQKIASFLSLIKFREFFKSKKSYALELKITNQLYIAGPIHLQKYKAWQPKVHQKDKLMIENRAFKVLTPVVDMTEAMTHVCLGRKLSLRSVASNLMPQALNQPRSSRYLIHNLPDYFQMIFNPQLVGLKTCPVDFTHWQFLEQAVYDDFEFMGQQGIQYLLDQRWTDLGIPLLNLGLKLADYVLNPSKEFRTRYYELHGGINSSKGMMLGQRLKNFRKLVCQTLKHIFRSELHLNSKFMVQSMAFYRDSETKSLCNDQLSAIWSKPDYEMILHRPAEIAKNLKKQDLAKFHLQERHRLITFEDLNEINSQDFKYENNYLNLLQRDISHFTSKAQWDKKKEKFIRQRLSCFIAQHTNGSTGLSSPMTKIPSSQGLQQRQNTTFYNALPPTEREQVRLLRRMVKMLHYLPEMHDFFKFAPTKHLIREQQAVLTNRVNFISFPSEEQIEENKNAGEVNSASQENAVPQGIINEEVLSSESSQPRLTEVKILLPHLLLSLDYYVSQRTMKCLQKMMIYGDLSLRISLIDQMIYFIKELMLESPEDHLVTQYLQTLTNMIKIWHQTETIKFQAATDQEIRPGFKLDKYTVFDLVSAGGESLQATALDDAAKNMYKQLHQHLQMFDLLDMVSILSLCNKGIFTRSLGCILIQETGKLKRLLIHKDKQRFILSDVLHYNRDKMIDNLTKRLTIFYGLKGQGFKPQKELRQIVERLQFYQFMVDNFEYQKFGLWESLVRDIQVLYIGDLARLWKDTLLKHTRVGGVILHFIQHLSGISLALFESKQGGGGVQDVVAQVSSTARDCAGFNLLLAIVLFNVTKSHDLRNRITSRKGVEFVPPEEDSDELEEVFSSGKLTTNTIMEEALALIAITETNFNTMHKITFSTFYPARLWTSNVLLSFLFYLQEPLDQKSLRNLNEIFIIRRLELQPNDAKQQQFVENCLIFYTLLMSNANDQFTSYVENQLEQETRQQEEQVSLNATDTFPDQDDPYSGGGGYPISKNLQEMTSIFTMTLDTVEFTDDSQGKKKFILRISMAHSICLCIQKLRESTRNRVSSTDYLTRDQQISLMQETRSQFNSISKSADLQWLCPMIKEIWFYLLSFEAIIGGNLMNTPNLLDGLDSGSDSMVSKAQPKPVIPAKLLDLKFLIQLEQDGYNGALKYYKYFHLLQAESVGPGNPRSTASNDAARINEIKLLIQHVYAFFGTKRMAPRSMLPDAQLKSDLSMISGLSADVSNYSRYPEQPMKLQKNVYFKCLVNCVIDTIALCKALESMKSVIQNIDQEDNDVVPDVKLTQAAQLAKSPFVPVYQVLVNCIFKTSKANLESRLRKFCQSNLHSKIFLVSLFVGLNSTDKHFIEKSRILSLAILPLMFPDIAYRKIVEDKIIAHAQTGQIKTLISHDNKHFYQFIKRIFLGEERYNMENHFEKYFSLSGFLRDILNEIIKLQGAESDQPQISPKMMLKVLDIVTYFFSGNIDLRRAPRAAMEAGGSGNAPGSGAKKAKQMLQSQALPQQSQESSFIFANLIDYKSFEFLSKLYKISEKLVDHDNDLLVMNMWYKVVENREHNFEILTKFLIHNLSSFIMKLRATSSKDTHQQINLNQSSQSQIPPNQASSEEDSYGIEYEKQKRYSLSIFNYIKARTQQIDVRNSLNVSSVCSWSQKMLKLVIRAQLNLHSKYTLEKMKLKKLLQILHAEINQSGVRLELKGGLDTLNRLLNQEGGNVAGMEDESSVADTDFDDVRRSVSMSQLLQSRTFMSTFGSQNKKDKTTLMQLLFIIQRQMSEKFDELTPDNQIMQLPDLVIKYFENSLIMIANESERLQIIKYSLKEEMTVIIMIILLMADLATKQCEINRFYFMYDLLNKLSLNIPGIQKYLKLQQLSMEQFQSITSEEEVLAVFNYRSAVDNFGVFTNIYFKMLHNTVAITKLHKFMLNLWWLVFEKIQMLLGKSENQQRIRDSVMGGQPPLLRPLYSRKQIVTMLQGCFFTLHQYSIKSRRAQESDAFTEYDLKALSQNFTTQVKCVMEYIQPAQLKMQSMRDFSDPFAQEISFATNAAFWLSYTCLEACAIAKSSTTIEDEANLNQTITSGVNANQQSSLTSSEMRYLEQIQELGMSTMRRILEESDFLKLLIGIQKLSSHFYSYSMSLARCKTALLPLLFAALENHKCCEDAYKSLIVTIRIQDSKLLNCSYDESVRAESELHRFLLLVPFFYQQFLGYEQSTFVTSNLGVRQSTTIFTNKKSIIQLLKKSLLSIGIDKKREILNILDELQLEVDQQDPKVIGELFGRLVRATCEICLAQESCKIIFEALKTFRAIASAGQVQKGGGSGTSSVTVVIENAILEQTIGKIWEVLNEHDRVDENEGTYGLDKESALFYSCSDIDDKLLGEQMLFVKSEIRPLYFGLKNIVLQEIESVDKDIDVHKFFIEEETAGFPTGNQNYVVSRSRSMYAPGVQKAVGAPSEGVSDATSDIASVSQQATSAYPTTTQAQLLRKKSSQQKKEMVSKYQNSQNVLLVQQQQPMTASPPLVKATSVKVSNIIQHHSTTKDQQSQQHQQQTRAPSTSLQQQAVFEQQHTISEEQPYMTTQYELTDRQMNNVAGSIQTLQTAVKNQEHQIQQQIDIGSGGGNLLEPASSLESSQLNQKSANKNIHNSVVPFDQQSRHANGDDSDQFTQAQQEFDRDGQQQQRRSSKIQLEDDERKYQQEQLSQILFEDDEDEDGDNANNLQHGADFQLTGLLDQQHDQPRRQDQVEKNLDRVEVALQPMRQAAKSFAESVIEEEHKHQRSDKKPQQQQPNNALVFHPEQEFNIAHDTSNEIDGLLGTFAKPPAQPRQPVPSLHFSQKNGLMHGEVPVDNQQFNFSQAMSSIEVRQTDRDMQQRNALIPNFVAEKVNEITNETDSQQERDNQKFGTGDFPADVALQVKQKFATVNRQNFRFDQEDDLKPHKTNAEQAARLSQLDGRLDNDNNEDERRMTQRFEPQKDFQAAKDRDLRLKTATDQKQQSVPAPVKMGGKAANFLDTHKTEDLPTPKKSQQLDTILIEIINDEELFYELENFLSEEKSYDVDSLAFYVKVMEFQKETNGMNATLAAGMIIDNYLAEDAQYYIGNEIKSDDLIARLIGEYEQVVLNQSPVPKDIFDGVCGQIRRQLMPYLSEFKQRDRNQAAIVADSSGFSRQ